MILTSLLATHASILSCIRSTVACALASSLIQCSSTTDRGIKSRHKVHFPLVSEYFYQVHTFFSMTVGDFVVIQLTFYLFFKRNCFIDNSFYLDCCFLIFPS